MVWSRPTSFAAIAISRRRRPGGRTLALSNSLVIRRGPGERRRDAGAGSPKQRRDQAGRSRPREPRADQARERKVGEPGRESPQPEGQRMQAEQRSEDQEEDTLAQDPNRSLRRGGEQRVQKVARAVDLQMQAEPGEIVIQKPGEGNPREDGQAHQRCGQKADRATEPMAASEDHLGERLMLLTMIASSRASWPSGGSALSTGELDGHGINSERARGNVAGIGAICRLSRIRSRAPGRGR